MHRRILNATSGVELKPHLPGSDSLANSVVPARKRVKWKEPKNRKSRRIRKELRNIVLGLVSMRWQIVRRSATNVTIFKLQFSAGNTTSMCRLFFSLVIG